MPVRVHLAGPLAPYAAGRGQVELPGQFASVAEALEALWALYPGVRDRVVTELGEIRPHVNVFVNAEAIRFTDGLATPVEEGAEIAILPAISGG
ncbi:MAG TPA: ubiquitin-like small modifier protein 1 [Thermoanaerobaculia bacterium]|nr:ubiquitin-like small modifier protein 1 [Thermoanaerobaculia bacterium]